jgi:hypothetical protein
MTLQRFDRVSAGLVLALLIPTLASAQTFATPPAQTFESMASFLKPGDRVTVIEKTGTKVTGKIVIVSASSVTLAVEGQRRDFAADTVRQVDRLHRQALKGLWIGFAIGAGLGLIASATDDSTSGSGGNAGGAMIGLGLTGGLYGSLIGACIPGHTTVFSAPAGLPSVVFTPHGGAAVFSVRF